MPEWADWRSQYERVSFGNERYSEVVRKVRWQGRVLGVVGGVVVMGMIGGAGGVDGEGEMVGEVGGGDGMVDGREIGEEVGGQEVGGGGRRRRWGVYVWGG